MLRIFFTNLALVLALAGCAVQDPPEDAGVDVTKFGASPQYVTLNGINAGVTPNLSLPACDAGLVWANSGPGSDGGCVAVEAGGGTSPVTTNDIVFDAGAGAVIGAQDGAITFGTQGQISCASADTTCEWTQASTSNATPATMTIAPQVSTAASNQAGSSVAIDLSTRTGTGAVGSFSVNGNSAYLAAMGEDIGTPTAYADLWLNQTTLTANDWVLQSNGSYLDVNTPSNTAIMYFTGGNGPVAAEASFATSVWGFGAAWNVSIGSVSSSDEGGGTALLRFVPGTFPTSFPTTTGAVLLGSQHEPGNQTIPQKQPAGLYGSTAKSIVKVIVPEGQGTIASQASTYLEYAGVVSTSSTTTTVIVAIDCPTSLTTTGALHARITGRATGTPSGGSVGDFWSTEIISEIQDASGTCSIPNVWGSSFAGPFTTIGLGSSSSMSGQAVSLSASMASAPKLNVVPSISTAIDWQAHVTVDWN